MLQNKVRWLAAAAFGVVMASATPAEAQRVTRIVALGDSYIDDGNVFELTGQPRPAVYSNGRFSNGTNFIDTMSTLLGVPVLNYGIGGAVARAQNTTLPTVQAFDLQVNSFLTGGGPAAFPRSSSSFAPDDLLVVNIGANDARAYQFSLGRTPTAAQITTLQAGVPAQAQLAAADANRNLDRLVAAGARQMTVLGGDVGRLPEVRGTPVAAVGTAYSTAYNNLVQQRLATYAQQGVIVNYLDLNKLGDVLEANLAAFNLINTGACPTSCVTTNPELLDRYFFYVDALHLTSRGFEIVGQYAVRQLEAPLHLEAQAETALLTATTFGEALEARADLSDARTGGHHGGSPFRLFVGGTYGRLSREANATSLNYTSRAGGIMGGVEYDSGNVMIGVAGSWSEPEARLEGRGEADGEALQGGVYAAASFGGAFIQGHASIGRIDLETGRDAVINRISGEAEGDLVTAGARIGYLFDVGALRIGPVAGVRYARAELDPYTEAGDPVLTLNVGAQELESTVASLGIEAQGGFELDGARFHPFLVATVEEDVGDEGDHEIAYANTASPGIVNRWRLEERAADTHGRLSGGLNVGLSRSITLQLAASATIGRDSGDEGSGSLAVRVGF